jgi:hypothetical protein
MIKKVFILGLPGSGKSTAAFYMDMIARDNSWTTIHIKDYDILYEWYQKDIEQLRFSHAPYGGFDVHDLKVFDEALQEVERRVGLLEKKARGEDKIIIIEFSRNDYYKALSWFTAPFLHDAYFLFVSTEIPTCKDRIYKRAANPTTENDHFVSDYIFEVYYNKDSRQYTTSDLNTMCDVNGEPYDIDTEKVTIIDNTDATSPQVFYEEVEFFTKVITGLAKVYQANTNTEPLSAPKGQEKEKELVSPSLSRVQDVQALSA